MQLYKDIVRLLIRACPKIANSFIRSNSVVYEWITSDERLMSFLIEYYQERLHSGLNAHLFRFFHLVESDRTIRDITIRKDACVIYFDQVGFYNTATKTLEDVQKERKSPQSENAIIRINQIYGRLRSLKESRFGDLCDMELMVRAEDLVSGVVWVLKEKTQKTRRWSLLTFFLYVLLFEVLFIIASSGKYKIWVFMGWIIVFALFAEWGFIEKVREKLSR